MRNCCLFLILVMGFSSLAWGEGELEKKSRFASAADIVGTWEMIYQKNGNLIPDDDPFVFPYQRFRFFPDGYVQNIAKTEPFDEMALAIWEVAPKTSKYRFTEQDVLLIEGSAGDVTLISVLVITEDLKQSLKPDEPKLKKGDLLLAYLTPTPTKVFLRRYLRRENPAQHQSVGQGEGIYFKSKSWGNFRHEKTGEHSFTTSNDPTTALTGYIKRIEVSEQTALQWAIDEAKSLEQSLEQNGIQIVVQPKEMPVGNMMWAMLAWEAAAPSTTIDNNSWKVSTPSQGRRVLFRQEQYFLKGKNAMVEVFLSAPKDVFSKANRQEIKQFLTSIRFVKSSVSSPRDGGELKKDR